MLYRFFAPSVTAATICFVSFVSANEAQPTEEIVVTATPLGHWLQPATVLQGRDLLLKSAASIGETLAGELGVSSSYFGPAASRPVIRGLSGSRVSVLTNTVSSLDASDISPDHSVSIEPLLADQLEVIRGPATLLYGNAAAGGVVNVTDSRIPEVAAAKRLAGGLELRGDLATQSRAVVGRLDGGGQDSAWHLDAYTRETENIDIAGFATADPEQREGDERSGTLANSYSAATGYAGGLAWVHAAGYLGASLSRVEQRYGLPGPEVAHDEAEENAALFPGPLLDMHQTRLDVRGQHHFDNGTLQSIKLALGANRYRHQEIEPSGEIATQFDNDAVQLRFEVAHQPLMNWRGSFGMQYEFRDLSAEGSESFVTPTESETIAGFIVEEKKLGLIDLHLGARLESTTHQNRLFGRYSKTTVSASAGLSAELATDTRAVFNLSRSERTAAAEELFSAGAHFATRQFELGLLAAPGNTADTEAAINVDLSLSTSIDAVDAQINVFYYRIGDYIYQHLDGGVEDGLPTARYRQNNAEFYGFEAELKAADLRFWKFDSELRLFSDYVHAELTNGAALPRIPAWRLGLNASLSQQRWRSDLDIIYNGEQRNVSSFKTDPYTMLDLSLSYAIGQSGTDWELFLRGTNLLNADARKSASFLAAFAPLPARSVSAGIRLRF